MFYNAWALKLEGMLLSKYQIPISNWILMASLFSVPSGLSSSSDLCSSNHWVFHRWMAHCLPYHHYSFYIVIVSLCLYSTFPPTYAAFSSISLRKPFFFTCRLSLSTAPGVSQYSLISVFPSATPFDIQGIPGLMHCKFFSIMNCDGRIKGMDMEHNLQRNVRDTEVVKALMNLNQQSWGT